jgi:thiol-disulfide isomerase/thioredoxin
MVVVGGLCAVLVAGVAGIVTPRLRRKLHRTPAYVETRLREGLNRWTLEGKPAPALEITQYLGPKPSSLGSLRGKPVLIYFWAHWCGDCRAEVPILARVESEYRSQGLTLLGPTQLYGYVARGVEAAPQQELAYIEEIRQKYYASLGDVPVPVSERNFTVYGALATPTLVLVNRQGMVQLYHPNELSYPELKAAVDRLVAQ